MGKYHSKLLMLFDLAFQMKYKYYYTSTCQMLIIMHYEHSALNHARGLLLNLYFLLLFLVKVYVYVHYVAFILIYLLFCLCICMRIPRYDFYNVLVYIPVPMTSILFI